jgi:hypothetical protein
VTECSDRIRSKCEREVPLEDEGEGNNGIAVCTCIADVNIGIPIQ